MTGQNTDKIRFAVIGCGAIGKLHAQLITKLPEAELVAVVDVDQEKGEAFAQQYRCRWECDYHAVLSDPEIDAVSVCLPSSMHSQIVIDAAEAGKHIVCEKPIDISVGAAQEMITAAEANNVRFTVIMQHRFDDPVIVTKKAVEDGKLGKVLLGESRTIWYRDDAYYANGWRGTWKFDGGGALINQSVHYIDLLLYFLGEPESVSAKCRKLLHEQIETEDAGIASIQFENGSIGTVEGMTIAYPGLYAELALYCERGTVIIRNDHLVFYSLPGGKDESFEKILDPAIANQLNTSPGISDESHRRQYVNFINSILKREKLIVTGEEALRSLRLIKGIYKASDEKREVFMTEEIN